MTAKIAAFETALSVFCDKHKIKSKRWTEIPRAQVFEISAPADILMYVKDSALPSGWWGIAFTVFNRLSASTPDCGLVLLVRDGEEGYALTATQVNGMVSGLSKNATEHIFHETDAAAGLHFKTFEALYQHLVA